MKLLETEAVECCPFCGAENIYPNHSTKEQGYAVKCQNCGEEIMLCDECMHTEDDLSGQCDWHEVRTKNTSYGICLRGITKHFLGGKQNDNREDVS